jgi:histidinol-phosphatase (PHP family)
LIKERIKERLYEFGYWGTLSMFDYHIHTKYCNHAVGEMEDYVQTAIMKNLYEMGFSCHIPYEYYPKEVPRELYAMSLKDLNTNYFPEIQRLQQKYKGKITIKTGLEIDYLSWIQHPINKFIDKYSFRLDYIIGSVHILKTNATVWSVDDQRFSHYFDKFNVDKIYNQYLDAIMELIHTRKYHILAHLDLPKKYGFRPQNTEKYYERITEILEEVKRYGMCVEVSTGGLRKYIRELYPEKRILKMMIDLNIPLITSSDSHKPEEVAFNFEELYSNLREMGVGMLFNYKNGQKYEISI